MRVNQMAVEYRNRTSGREYRQLATAVDKTSGRNGMMVVVYAPIGRGQSVLVMEAHEFHERFERVDDIEGED